MNAQFQVRSFQSERGSPADVKDCREKADVILREQIQIEVDAASSSDVGDHIEVPSRDVTACLALEIELGRGSVRKAD